MNTVVDVSKYTLQLVLELAWASLPRVLLCVFASLAVSLIGLVLLGRRGVFRREPRAWNVLSKLAYVYLPLVLMVSAVAFGLLTSAHGLVERRVKEELSPLVRSSLPTIRTWLTEQVDWRPGQEYSLDEAAMKILRPLYYEPKSAGLLEHARARITNYVSLNFGKWVITAGLAALLTYAAGRAGESVGLDKDTVKFSIEVIREMDLSRIDDNFGQVFQRALLARLGKLFEAFYLKMALLTLGALSLPAIDAGVYFLWYRRRSLVTAPPSLAE